MTKKNYVICKKYVIYGKKNLVLMIKNIKRLEIIALTLENIDELLMILQFKIQNTKRNSRSIS